MKRLTLLCVIFTIILTSCSKLPAAAESEITRSITPEFVRDNAPSDTPQSTVTIEPSVTVTNTPTIQPTPIGGKNLTIAYHGFDCEDVNTDQCVIIADFFTHQVIHRIPISSEADNISLSWSPNGRYLLYCNIINNIMHVMLYDMVLTDSTEIDTHIYMNPTSESGMVTRPYPNQVYPMKWSADSQYIAYNLHPYYISVYSVEDEKVSLFKTDFFEYYWLNDNENIVEIKSGVISNVKTGKQSTVKKSYFWNIDTRIDGFILSRKGQEPSWNHEVYIIPYIKDLETLQEEGIPALNKNELLFAHAKDNDRRGTSLQIDTLLLRGDQVIFSGTLTRTKPYERQSFVRFESIHDVPFLIEIDNENGYFRDNERILMFSPDQSMYFTMDTIWDEDQKVSFLLQSYFMIDHELIYTYDLHEMAKDPHEIDYYLNTNLAFSWEE